MPVCCREAVELKPTWAERKRNIIETIKWNEEIERFGEYDVLVAGGGVAGVAAALAAARHEKRVLLVEKQCCLGGLATGGIVNFWVPLCNGRGRMIIRGIAEELLRLSIRYGFDTLPSEWKHGEPDGPTKARCAGWFSGGMFALQLLELLRNAGVTILYDATVLDAVMAGSVCLGVILRSGAEKRFYRAKMIVDATGDAEILCRAGVPTVEGANYHTYYGEGITLQGCEKALATQNIYWAYTHPYGGTSDLHGGNHPEELPLYQGTDPDTVNRYLQDNQLEMLAKEKLKPRFSRNIHMLPTMPQLRTARCIDGDETFTAEGCYRHCGTSVGVICDFEYRDRLYEVPYGSLVRTGFDNLITCGRSACASGWGWDALRVIPPAILTGQAAGTAAAMAVKHSVSLPKLSIEVLQEALERAGVAIHFEDDWVPEQDAEEERAVQADHI